MPLRFYIAGENTVYKSFIYCVETSPSYIDHLHHHNCKNKVAAMYMRYYLVRHNISLQKNPAYYESITVSKRYLLCKTPWWNKCEGVSSNQYICNEWVDILYFRLTLAIAMTLHVCTSSSYSFDLILIIIIGMVIGQMGFSYFSG